MTYEYVCTSCHHEWEAEQRISEPALDTCPACRQRTARRQVSGGAGFILKGGGWYADGYSSGGARAKKGVEGSTHSTASSSAASGGSSASSAATSPAVKPSAETGKAGSTATSAKPAAA